MNEWSQRTPVEHTVTAFDSTEVTLGGVVPAGSFTSMIGRRQYLHAGPPLSGAALPVPMRGALIGALLFEGEATSARQAMSIVEAGDFHLTPCHALGGVGAMAGIVSPSMPLVVVESRSGHAFSPLNEGPGRAVRFGCHDVATIANLRRIALEFAPVLDRAAVAARVNLIEVLAEALRRGDECHNRTVAGGAILLLGLVPFIVRLARKGEDISFLLTSLSKNPHFFSPFALASCKAIADAGDSIQGSTVVTAISSNGNEFGIRLSGLGGRWFTAPAPHATRLKLFPKCSRSDAHPLIGDSPITETVGLGASALTAAPAISTYIGSNNHEATSVVRDMMAICVSKSERFRNPATDFAGVPLGIDAREVVRRGIAPTVNHGVAHHRDNAGQAGAGLTRLPLDPFKDACLAADETAAISSAHERVR